MNQESFGGFPRLGAKFYHEGMIDETAIRRRYEAMCSRLDERERRLFVAAEARAAGYGVLMGWTPPDGIDVPK